VQAATARHRPNIVFILADDLSWNLINKRFTPHIMALAKRGETFTNYFVTDSLCCPSRSTIFTGLFPHDTQVFTNSGKDGGYLKFQSQGLYRRTFAVALQKHGYQTSMLGKYLNGYGDPVMTPATAPIPPGWSDWHVSNRTGYAEFNYLLNDNGTINHYGGPTAACHANSSPDNYGVDVLNEDARSFIARAKRRPFAVEAATFAPHDPFVPAPRNACDFPGLMAPRYPSFDRPNINPPAWLAARRPIGFRVVHSLDRYFRMRAQSMEAVDKLVGDVQNALRAAHQLNNTYVVFSSDNGFHIGQHMLTWGKLTAFDSDIRVPLIVAGPGVPKNRRVPQVAQNTDLYPTFLRLAGGFAGGSIDGHSLVGLLHPSGHAIPWRTVALVEHHGLKLDPTDPDFDAGVLGGDPTTYEAIRIQTKSLPHFKGPVNAVWVEYQDSLHETEFYNLRRDPFERDNVANQLTPRQRSELHGILVGLERCHGQRACWQAGRPRG
jgi:N-acetylglucosamine-6-sulfatase